MEFFLDEEGEVAEARVEGKLLEGLTEKGLGFFEAAELGEKKSVVFVSEVVVAVFNGLLIVGEGFLVVLFSFPVGTEVVVGRPPMRGKLDGVFKVRPGGFDFTLTKEFDTEVVLKIEGVGVEANVVREEGEAVFPVEGAGKAAQGEEGKEKKKESDEERLKARAVLEKKVEKESGGA